MKVQTILIKEGKELVSNLEKPIEPSELGYSTFDGLQANKTFESSFIEVSNPELLDKTNLGLPIGFIGADALYTAPTGLEMEVKADYVTNGEGFKNLQEVALITFQSPEKKKEPDYTVFEGLGQKYEPLEGKEETYSMSRPVEGGEIGTHISFKAPSTVDESGEEESEDDIIKFLCGEASFNGVWFGEINPADTPFGKFWWRTHLRKHLKNQDERIKELEERVNELGDFFTVASQKLEENKKTAHNNAVQKCIEVITQNFKLSMMSESKILAELEKLKK